MRVGILLSLLLLASTSAAADPTEGIADRARRIAADVLRANTVRLETAEGPRQYLLAGGHQFHAVWTRDLSFAVPGALSVGLTQAVKDSLDLVFSFQRADGELPRAIDGYTVPERVVSDVLGIRLPFRPPFRASFVTEHKVVSTDSNLLVPWAAWTYIAATGDLDSARRWYEPARRALELTQQRFTQRASGLLGGQPPYSDWEDSVQRTGHVAYTNVIHVLALRAMAAWAARLGERGDAYAQAAELQAQRLQAYFWNPGRGALDNFDGNGTLTADANLLAVVYGVLPEPRARTAMATLRASPLWDPLPGRPTYPNYETRLKAFLARFAGIGNYHDEDRWLWITALAARAEARIGDCAEYDRIMAGLGAQIAHDGTVLEILGPTVLHGVFAPIRELLYRPEKPFTWSAAMYLDARRAGCSP